MRIVLVDLSRTIVRIVSELVAADGNGVYRRPQGAGVP